MDNKKFIKLLILGVIIIAVGSIVMNHTDSILKIVMIAAGIMTLIDGITTLANTKKWNLESTTKTLSEIKGYESIAIGAAAIIIAIFLNAAITVMVYIFAAGLIFSAIVSFQNAAVGKNYNIAEKRNRFMLEAVIKILVAIILICNPVGSLMTIAKIAGIVIIVIGALVVAAAVLGKVKASKAKETVGEAEVVEENN